jgi:hypothetical protein
VFDIKNALGTDPSLFWSDGVHPNTQGSEKIAKAFGSYLNSLPGVDPNDSDGDGIPDDNDNCPNYYNPNQTDSDGDGIGDACDSSPYGGGNTNNDSDGDGVLDSNDNCPNHYNPNQTDSDGDGIGDACDSSPNGNGNPEVIGLKKTIKANGCLKLSWDDPSSNYQKKELWKAYIVDGKYQYKSFVVSGNEYEDCELNLSTYYVYTVEFRNNSNGLVAKAGPADYTVQSLKIEDEGLLSFKLGDNYPNPFNPNTTIEFNTPVGIDVEINIYNLLGEKIVTIYDDYAQPGDYTVTWDGTDAKGNIVPSGTYLYELKTNSFYQTKMMTLGK